MDGFLIIAKGAGPIRFGPEVQELRIGRTPDNDLVLDDAAVSRHHARIFRAGGGVWLEDLGSRHGCTVNGRRLTRPVPVQVGDRFLVGQVLVQLEPGPALQEPVTEPLPESISVALPIGGLRLPGAWGAGDPDRWARLLGILHELSLEMIRACPADQLLNLLLYRLSRFFGARRGSILLLDPQGGLRPLASCAADPDGRNGLLRPATAEEALLRREALVVESSSVDPHGTKSTTLSMMNIPLEFEGELLGVVCLEEGAGPFTEADLRLAVSLCNLASAKAVLERRGAEIRRKEDLERQFQAMADTTRAKSELLANVSHEIRNPLAGLMGFVDLALHEDLPERAKGFIRKIDQSACILKNLLDDLLDLSKVEFGKMRLESIPFSLKEVVQGAAGLFESQAERKALRLQVDWEQALPARLLGDPLRLGQVLTNLVGNAVKFTEHGSVRLAVRLRTFEGAVANVQFSVNDTGPGMSEAQLERIFEPFAQAEDSTSRRYGGTGLGLAISRRLVELMGGRLELESRVGDGSTFSFQVALPVAVETANIRFEPEARSPAR